MNLIIIEFMNLIIIIKFIVWKKFEDKYKVKKYRRKIVRKKNKKNLILFYNQAFYYNVLKF